MRKARGFHVGRRLARAFKWFVRPRWRRVRLRLGNQSAVIRNPFSKIKSLARHLRIGAKRLCSRSWVGDYLRLDGEAEELLDAKAAAVPKGHLAVYVGESDEDAHRVLVPVIYFNHPLFGELLREAEKVYGFDHPGGITIPCRVSEFEKVKTRIAAGDEISRRPKWKGSYASS